MHFGLTEEQRVLQEESGRFFADLAPKARADAAGAWATLTELGWQALAIPAAAGGSDRGSVDLAVVLTESGRSLLALPLLSTAGLAGAFLSEAGPEALAFLERLAGGEAATLAYHGPDGLGLEPGPVRLEGARLSGIRALVTDAAAAAFLVVPVSAEVGARLAVVEAGAARAFDVEGIDSSRALSCLSFEGAEVAAMLPLALEAGSSRALTALSAELLGVAEGALSQAVGYALQREQFGQKIGSYQAIKHRLADCYVAVERARSLVYAAAMLCDDPDAAPDQRSRAASMAKAVASEAALGATAADVQVHAAIAVTREHTALDFLRRARQGAALLGTHLAHLGKVGRSFVEEVADGHP